jgi:hypothetical protein
MKGINQHTSTRNRRTGFTLGIETAENRAIFAGNRLSARTLLAKFAAIEPK